MIEESEQLSERLAFPYVVRITSESNPRDARLTARRSNGSALHTLDHQFSKSGAKKLRAKTPILTGGPDPSQWAFIVEDTTLPPSPLPGARWQVSGARRPTRMDY
jgi:hypothetical protein